MRNSLKIAVLILCTICLPFTGNAQQTTGKEDRAFWVENLTRIADPVLVNLSNNTLKKNMPYESLGDRRRFSHLEAVGRLVCGIAPWLELGPDNTPEGKLREKYINLTVKGLILRLRFNSVIIHSFACGSRFPQSCFGARNNP